MSGWAEFLLSFGIEVSPTDINVAAEIAKTEDSRSVAPNVQEVGQAIINYNQYLEDEGIEIINDFDDSKKS